MHKITVTCPHCDELVELTLDREKREITPNKLPKKKLTREKSDDILEELFGKGEEVESTED